MQLGMARFDSIDLLDAFVWAMDRLSKPTFRNLVAGVSDPAEYRRTVRLLREMERKKWVSRMGKRLDEVFAITAKGQEALRQPDPENCWGKRWDGAWRVVTFDVPMVRNKERYRLWRALRARNLGFLQRSVWIWPHDMRPILQEIIRAEGVPECFCGFEARRLFLCNDAEIVETAWDFEEIGRRHRTYRQHPRIGVTDVRACANHNELACWARMEREAYAYALARDPLLPRELWPRAYRGEEVVNLHRKVRLELARRFAELAG
jgi:DNA-binding transcriptional regulator PaaX